MNDAAIAFELDKYLTFLDCDPKFKLMPSIYEGHIWLGRKPGQVRTTKPNWQGDLCAVVNTREDLIECAWRCRAIIEWVP